MGSQDAAALEEIVVAGGLSQQRLISEEKLEHRHDDGSQRRDTTLIEDSASTKGFAEGSHVSIEANAPTKGHRWHPKSPGHLDLNAARSPRTARAGEAPRRRGLGAEKSSRRLMSPKSPSSNEEDFKFDDDLEEEATQKKPFWRRWKFYRNTFLFLFSFAFITAGVLLRIFNHTSSGPHALPPTNAWDRFKADVQNFELWRWMFFFGGIAPIWWIGDFVVRLLVLLVESAFLNTKNVMYFLVAIRKPVGYFVRAVLLMPLYVPLFAPKASSSATAGSVYTIVLKAIACLILFTFANVLSTLLAKLMASHFHKATHFYKMQEAIRKEYYLSVLSAPRPGRASKMMAFSSDVDLAALGRSGSSGSDGDGQRGSKAVPLTSQLYNTLVAPVAAAVLPSGQNRANSAPLIWPDASVSAAVKHMQHSSTLQRDSTARSGSTGGPKQARGSAKYPAQQPAQPPAQPPPETADSARKQAPGSTDISETTAGIIFSNPMVLPDARLHPIKIPRGLTSPPRPPMAPPSANGGYLATMSQPEHAASGREEAASMTEGGSPQIKNSGEKHDILTDPAAADYYGAGHAERVAAARDKARRKLMSNTSRESCATPTDTPEVNDAFGELPRFGRSSRRWSTTSSPYQKEPEKSSGSQEKLLRKESGLGKWGSLGTKEKFNAADLMAEVIENSEQPPDLREGDEHGHAMAARLHAVEKHLRKNPLQGGTFYDKLQRSTSKKGFAEAAEKQAKRVAFYIYWNVKPDSGRTFLIPSDFEELLPLEQSREAFGILDSDGNNQLTPGELCRGVTQIYKERANLAVQLKDTKSVVGRLKFVISVVLHIVFIFFYLMIYNVDIQKVWLLFSSVVLAFAFIFGNSIRQLYEAVIFLFVIHPYDVGDWLKIGTNQYQVEEISLAITTLRGADNVRQYYPNTQMVGASIVNLSRSDNKFDNFTVPVATGTPTHVLDALAQRLDALLRVNRGEYTGARECVYQDVQDVFPVRTIIFIAFQYTHSTVDVGRTLKARSAVIREVHDALHELGVYAPDASSGGRAVLER
ncbi:hypothetical protein CVIRNUC_010587 [Coccomyxa viridis]|uniref:EF-hand domain-containing protein n=1 Tax=Coccomyxa viridis TaxID=1274662 RepID=A0AAV1IJE1_9CHLO|nr:hypothetical protein CVIRNUC_010587 [Coccomyxa viridis]